MASDILSYNVVQDHEGISIKGYRGLRPPGDLISRYRVSKVTLYEWIQGQYGNTLIRVPSEVR